MKKQIRLGVFETNSSSTHSITICSEEEWEGFKDGKLAVNDAGKFMPIEKLAINRDYDPDDYPGRFIDPADSSWDNEYENYDAYFNDDYLEGYEYQYTTKSGDKIVAFGKYGHD